MQVEINISEVLKVDQEGFICFNGKEYLKKIKPSQQEKGLAILSKIINNLGQRSAISQKLKQKITSTTKFFGTDQRMCIKVAANKVLGFIKVGQRKLFYHDYSGAIKELFLTAVLDVYVYQSCQRTGIGKEIFQKFLKSDGKSPQKLAYDRPSQKLISFLKRHYNLCSFIPQNNNYVIFDRYFQRSKDYKITQIPTKQRSQKVLQKAISNTIQTKRQSQVPFKKLNLETNEATFEQPRSFKETKDQSRSSFGCPWAIQQKIGFKTTSNHYGNHYARR